jgi:hypothetical protein
MILIDSSNIKSVGFLKDGKPFDRMSPPDDDVCGSLLVKFVNGSTYEYLNVPFRIFVSMLTARSTGQYLNEVVKKTGEDGNPIYPFKILNG